MTTTAAASSTPTPIVPAGSLANPTSTDTTTGGANGTDPTGTLTFTQNFNTFLTLLTTQLKNQDPLSPMNTDQFTQQLVMFSEVEQQIKTNSQLGTLISNGSSAEAISALPMVGRSIEYNGNQAILQNGQASFSYTLPTTAAAATVGIEDASGNTIFLQKADPSAGRHTFTWNGQTLGGQQMPDGGTYKVVVQATDANNQPITATTTATGTVTGVSVNHNVATFDVSGIQVPMSQLVTLVSGTASSNPTNTASN
jgi:flagellar basal-body rod modification protein FlgD